MSDTGNIILASVVIGLVVISLIKMSGSARISKRFVLKLLQDIFPDKEFVAESIVLKEMDTFKFSTAVPEKTYMYVKAKTKDEEAYELEVRTYDPAAEIEEEKYEASIKNARPKEDNINNPMGSGHSYAAGVDMAQNMLREQNKIEEEDRMLRAKEALHERDVNIVQQLSSYTSLFPNVYKFIPKKRITCCSYTGQDTLATCLQKMDKAQKLKLLTGVVRNLAQLHSHDHKVLALFPEKIVLDADSYKVALERSLDNMVKAGLLRTEAVRSIANEYYPLAQYVSKYGERGLRIKNCSSYELYVNRDQVYLRDWDGFSFDLKALNLAELLNDPACALTGEEQAEFLQLYVEQRCLADSSLDPQELLKGYDFAATGFLVAQLNYLAVYISQTKDLEPEQLGAAQLINWDKPHMQLLLDILHERLMHYEESRAFAMELQGIFTDVLTSI